MITETPLEYLQQAVTQIKDDIDGFAKPNRKGTNYTDAYRANRVAEFRALLTQYETAINILEKSTCSSNPNT